MTSTDTASTDTTTAGPAQEDFLALAQPYRRELLAHCYRMLGSMHDAEDMLQETLVRGWRSYEKFEGRSSLRTWLHRIATSVCLTALETRRRRPTPAGLGGPSPAEDPLVEGMEVPWLEPVPDAAVGVDAEGADPAVVVAARSSVRLAFVAALQHLPARQRAVLLLREVLQWKAAEVADLLGTSVAGVNSALQRARAQIAEISPAEDDAAAPLTARQQDLLDSYVAAFERKDVDAMTTLLAADVVWEMPPLATWYLGRGPVGTHLRVRCPGGPGAFRLVPVAANGQPAYGLYLRDDGAVHRPFGIHVLTLGAGEITHVHTFLGETWFPRFGLPLTLEPDAAPAADTTPGAADR